MSKFKPGQSGNPAGLRRGPRNPLAAAKKMLAPHVEQLVEIALADALSGDHDAARVCLSVFAAADQKNAA